MHKLVFNGTYWVPDTNGKWNNGKLISYPDGHRFPDSEDITLVSEDIYVCSERDNTTKVSQLTVLRYVDDPNSSTLTAKNMWDLTADLPAVDKNLGFEAITWVPDSFLVLNQFKDDSTGLPYVPTMYPNHGSGLFFLGLEGILKFSIKKMVHKLIFIIIIIC